MQERSLSLIEKMPDDFFSEMISFLDNTTNLNRTSKEITSRLLHTQYININGRKLNKKLWLFLTKERSFKYYDEEGYQETVYRYFEFYTDPQDGKEKLNIDYLNRLTWAHPDVVFHMMQDPGILSLIQDYYPAQTIKTKKSIINMLISTLVSLVTSALASAIFLPFTALSIIIMWMTLYTPIFIARECDVDLPVPRALGFGILAVPFAIIGSALTAGYCGYHQPISFKNMFEVIKASFKMIYEICFARFDYGTFTDPWTELLNATHETFADTAAQYQRKHPITTAQIVQKHYIKNSFFAKKIPDKKEGTKDQLISNPKICSR